MLRGFLAGLGDHLVPGGEGWLVMSDLAERLELRGPDELAQLIAQSGLVVLGRHDTRPTHARDPRHHRPPAFRATRRDRLALAAGPGGLVATVYLQAARNCFSAAVDPLAG